MQLKLIFHCGFFKTGTSSIQNMAWHNRTLLRKWGIYYPSTGISDNAEEIGYRHSRLMYEIKKPEWADLVTELVHEINTCDCETVLLSSEAWSRPGGFKAFKQLIDALSAELDFEFETVFYLRNVYDYARSHYREFVKRWNYKQSFNDYLELRRGFFDYKRLLKPFAESYPSQLCVKYYEPGLDTVSDFFGHLGLSARRIKKLEQLERVNKSPSALDTQLNVMWNSYYASLLPSQTPPTANAILRNLGLETRHSKTFETFPAFGFLKNFTKSYHSDLQTVTKLSSEQVQQLLALDTQPQVDVERLVPVLKHALMEYLKA